MSDTALLAGGAQARSRLLPVTDASQVNEARREAVTIAAGLGFGETERYQVQIVASELATNLALHAGGGHLIVRPIPRGIELLAVDRGRGMDVAKCLRDGYSTAGTAGNGLGAIKRLCQVFDVHSMPGKGSVVLGQLHLAGQGPAAGPRIGAVCLPYPGETACGDAWAVAGTAASLRVVVADGLGHGPSAAEASDAALQEVISYAHRAPSEIIQHAHLAIRHTRGAAIAVCGLEPAGVVRFAGVGNISGVLIDGTTPPRSMVSSNGILGHQVHKVQDFTYQRSSEGLLVMHSDGIGTRWKLEDYPGLALRHPSLVAATLWRDAARGRDDATVVVVSGA